MKKIYSLEFFDVNVLADLNYLLFESEKALLDFVLKNGIVLNAYNSKNNKTIWYEMAVKELL